MSLEAYQRVLARMVAEPDLRRAIAADPARALARLRLDDRERRRLISFAADPGMRVNTALYRANRLGPIYNSLPRTCDALGGDIGPLLHAFWRSRELEDLQFPNEVARFVAFLRGGALPERRGLASLVAVELAIFELLLLPRRRLRETAPAQLVREIAVDVDPRGLIAVIEDGAALADCARGAGAVRIDHREDPGRLEPVSSRRARAARAPARSRRPSRPRRR